MSIRDHIAAIEQRINRATQWPWRRHGSTVVAPGVHILRADGRDFEWYAGELVAESIGAGDADLIERAPEDLRYLCSLVRVLLEDRDRLEFLLSSRYAAGDRAEVDRLAAIARERFALGVLEWQAQQPQSTPVPSGMELVPNGNQ